MVGRTVTVTLDADTSGLISSLTKAGAAATRFADKTSASIGKNRDGLQHLTNQAGLLGLATAAGTAVAVKGYADFDSAVSSVAATGADARKNLNALREAAIQAGADTKYSATEAAAGQEALAKANVSAKDSLSGGLKGALDLAAAGNLGVAESAETAAFALAQFKLQGKDVPHIADLLAAGAGKANGEVSDLAAALKQGGQVASDVGLSLEETTGGLAAFANAGLIGSDSGTAFKTMLQSLTPTSLEAQRTMGDLGISAYDSQGSFVGLANFADSLRNGLKDLSDEQRNAALKTIFGSDAVRAASVIYREGGEGIREWTEKVNDSGYASEVARVKMDNLRGDLELLSGSAETALIGLGKGSDGPLRSLVQNATEGVNAFTKLDDQTQATFLALAGGVATTALAAAGVGKLAIAANDAKVAFDGLGISAKTATIAAVGIGAAIGVAAIAYGHWATQSAESRARVDDFTTALQSQTDAIQDNVTKVAAKQLQDSGALTAARGLGLELDTITQAALGNAQALAKVESAATAAFSVIDTTAEYDSAAQQRIADAQVLTDALKLTGSEYSKAVSDARDFEDATKGTGAASLDAASSYGEASGGISDMGGEAKDAKQQIDDLVDSLFDSADAAISLSDAEIGYERAVAAATEAAKENKKSTDLSTEAGRDQRESLNRQADASKRYIEQLVSQDASTKDVREATKDAREAFIKNAIEMGHSATEAKNLADKQGLIERDIKIAIEAPKMPKALSDFELLKNRIGNLPKQKQIDIIFGSNAAQMAESFGLKLTQNSGERDSVDSSRRKNGTGMARGGILPGDTPLYRGDDIAFPMATGGIQPLRGGEGITVTEAMHDPFERARLLALNKAALNGESLARFRDDHGLAAGGVVTLGVGAPPPAAVAGVYSAIGDRLATRIGNSLGSALEKRLGGLLGAGGGGIGPIDVNNPRGITSFRGGRVTNLGAANLRKAEEIAGVVMRVMQGGFRPTTSYSGTSHAGDAVDTQADARLIRALRKVGWASGDRTGLGNWGPHAHSVPTKGHGFAGGSAVYQAGDYLRRGGANQSLGSPWGLATGGLVKGGRGGVLAQVGEGKHDELVLPLPKGLADLVGKADIAALIRALQAPQADIAAAIQQVSLRLAQSRKAGDAVPRAEAALELTKAVRRRQGRTVNAFDAQSREATGLRDDLQERRETVSDRREALRDRRDALQDRRDDAKGKRRRELDAQLDRVNRQLADAEKQVAQVEKQARAARLGEVAAVRALKRERADLDKLDEQIERRQKSLAAAIDRTRRAAEKAADAQRAAAEARERADEAAEQAAQEQAAARQAKVDEAKQIAKSFADLYRTTTPDALDWIERMTEGAAELKTFTTQIAALRKAGLSEPLVQQVLGLGALSGGEVATQISGGGAGLVKSLNDANASLTKAADSLGTLAGSGIKKFGAGGPVVGRSGDRNLIYAADGEWVVPEDAVPANRPFLEAITYGRSVVAHNYARSPYGMAGPAVPVAPQVSVQRPVNVQVTMPAGGHSEAAAAALGHRIAADLVAMGV